MNNLKTTLLLLPLWTLYGCASDEAGEEPATETGFHKDIPGFFNYFHEEDLPCGMVNQDGVRCTILYDDLGRKTFQDCEGSYTMSLSYTESPTTRTTVWEDHVRGTEQTDIETYAIVNGRVSSQEFTRFTEHAPDGYTFFLDYIRDDLGRLESIDSTGSQVGQIVFFYDDVTSLLSRTVNTITSSEWKTGVYEADYEWDGSLLTEARYTSPSNTWTSIALLRHFYNENGESIAYEEIDSDGVSTVWTNNFSCEESNTNRP